MPWNFIKNATGRVGGIVHRELDSMKKKEGRKEEPLISRARPEACPTTMIRGIGSRRAQLTPVIASHGVSRASAELSKTTRAGLISAS